MASSPRTVPTRRLAAGLCFGLMFLSLLPLDASAVGEHLICGRDIELRIDRGRVPDTGLRMRQPAMEKRAATIVLVAGPGLAARPDALDAWNRAVAIWEAELDDDVTVLIEGEFDALPAGVLGGTSSRSFQVGYDVLRDAVVSDRSANESFLAQLPNSASFSITVPPGFGFSGNLSGTKASLRALGFDMSFDDPNPDASIIFSTGFEADFDYDPSDGIDAGKFDFEAIVVHELGHALGFTSEVDDADFLRDDGQTGDLIPTTLDLFRLVPGEGASDFNGATRPITTGDLQAVQVLWDGSQELGLSTGTNLGDGRQASHWKADELTGTFLGIMDPTLSRGERETLTPNDVRAFGLFGWDVAAPITDCNGNQVDDATDIANGTADDCNLNGVPDSCDIASGNSQDVDSNQVPDECALTAAPEYRDVALEVHPNPFNPRTSIFFEIASSGPVRIEVFDVAGRHVRTLSDQTYTEGRHRVDWDGRGDAGRAAPSGVYFVVLQHAGGSQQTKISLLK